MVRRAVVDTNILIGALLKSEGHNRPVLKAVFNGQIKPIVGLALYLEYEDVMGRDHLFTKSPLTRTERHELFHAFLNICEWVDVYYLWRPNLPDEGDNHIVELAVAGNASLILTNNVSDFRRGQLRFPAIRILTPRQFAAELA